MKAMEIRMRIGGKSESDEARVRRERESESVNIRRG